jgi:hypothetical protein
VLVTAGCGFGAGRSGRDPRAGTTSAGSSPVAGSSPAALPPEWRLAEHPELRPGSALSGVVAVDATHAWAVGFEGYSMDQRDTSSRPVVLRWNGTAWSRDPLPGVAWFGALRRVAAGSATDVWAVGDTTGATPGDTVTRVLRDTGDGWREVPFPAGNDASNVLITGLAAAGGQAWLVGNKGSAVVIQHWDGNGWQAQRPPAECGQAGTSFGGMPTFCTFTGVTAFAPNNVWVAGNASWPGFQGPVLFHWNGSEWRPVQVGVNEQLYFLTAVSGGSPTTDLWAVGNLFNSGQPFVVRGNGPSWKVVPGLADGKLDGVAVNADGRPWILRNTIAPGANLVSYSADGGWFDTPSPRPPGTVGSTLSAITAVPGTPMMFAVGTADLPTEPRTVTALMVQYAVPPLRQV